MLTKGYVTVQDLNLDPRWTDQEICDYYDTHPNETIKDLALRSGYSASYVKKVLMEETT